MSDCRNVVQFIDAFIDGELPADTVLEIEQHLTQCSLCEERVRLTRAVQVSTRLTVLDGAMPSKAFATRITAALAAEQQREVEQAEREAAQSYPKPLPWHTIAPIAAAAGLALAFGAARANPGLTAQAGSNPSEPTFASAEQLIEELVNHHVRAPAPEVTEPALLPRLEPDVGVPVKLLPSLGQYGASWEGGSVVPLRNQPTASLRYRLDGHRVTVYVYDSERVPLRYTRLLTPRVVQDAPVFVGTRRGYSIAAIERRGVGYAVATDLDTRESAELVASIH